MEDRFLYILIGTTSFVLSKFKIIDETEGQYKININGKITGIDKRRMNKTIKYSSKIYSLDKKEIFNILIREHQEEINKRQEIVNKLEKLRDFYNK